MIPAGRAALGVVLVLATSPAVAQRVLPPGQVTSGTLSFDAQATLGDFTGKTSTISGAMTGASELREVRGWVEAPVNSLKTGNGLRDKDLLKAMEAEAHPVIRFDLEGVTVQSESADSSSVTLLGRFQIHGVEREVVVPATLRFGADGIRVSSDIPMNVKDYGVTRLSKVFGAFKMNENIMVHIDLVFAPGAAPAAAVPGARPPGGG
jgi:polyisoprenoid-binding protein YceI